MIFPTLPLAASFGEFISGLLQTVVAGALFFVSFALLRSHLRFQFLTRQVKGEAIGEMDINSEDAFQIQVAQYLSAVGKSPQPFAIVALEVVDQDRVAAEVGPEIYKELQDFLLKHFQDVCRSTDTVTWKDERVLGLVLELEREKLVGAIERILSEALKEPFRSTHGVFLKPTLRAGAATFPDNGFSLRQLVQLAEQSLDTAKAQAGQKPVLAPIDAATEIDPATGEPEMIEQVGPEDQEELDEELAEDTHEPPKPVAPGAPPLPPGAANQGKSLLDPMTGVLRADKVGPVMQRFVAKYRKDELPVSILYLDIDSLDRYNKHYGRKAGDNIIKEVSRIIQETTREEDIIGRVDGEEFIVSMACTPQQATLVGARLLAEIKRTQIPFGNSSLRITACVGIAGFPDHGGMAKHLYDAADAALGAAKMKGRNMAVMFQRGMRAQQVEVKKVDAF